MRIIYVLIVSCVLLSTSISAQSVHEFGEILKDAAKSDLDESTLNDLMAEYSAFLTPHSSVTAMWNDLLGEQFDPYPLADLKVLDYYPDLVLELFNSENTNHRILSYLVIASTNDARFMGFLRERLKSEEAEGNLIWACMALLHLKDDHTTEIFDFLVENQKLPVEHMFPLFLQLDSDLINQTAYERISSENNSARILAVSVLAQTGGDEKTEEVIRAAVRDWPIEIKGYAIRGLMMIGAGNLLPLLEPLLHDTLTAEISLNALAASPSAADREYVLSGIPEEKEASRETLNRLLQSNQPESVRKWLQFVGRDATPDNYFVAITDESVLHSDELYDDLMDAMNSMTNGDVLQYMLQCLRGRKDDQTTTFLVSLLRHPHSGVRYWAGTALEGNGADRVKSEAIQLVCDTALRTTAICNLVIEFEVDTLQSVFEKMYADYSGVRDWRRSSIEYLSLYPHWEHREIFRKIVQNKKADWSTKRDAALGLGRLKDTASVDIIIEALIEEASSSDYNARTYLEALSYIGDDKCKATVEYFLDSYESEVRKFAEELLREWPE